MKKIISLLIIISLFSSLFRVIFLKEYAEAKEKKYSVETFDKSKDLLEEKIYTGNLMIDNYAGCSYNKKRK